jgi:hypothetical protein
MVINSLPTATSRRDAMRVGAGGTAAKRTPYHCHLCGVFITGILPRAQSRLYVRLLIMYSMN